MVTIAPSGCSPGRLAFCVRLSERLEPVAQRLLGRELDRRVERGVHVQPTLEHEVGAVLGLQRLLDVLQEVLAGGAAPLRRNQAEIGARQPLGVGVLERAVVHHPAQHDLAPTLGRLTVLERRVRGRRARKPGEQRGLADVELRDRLAEVRPGGGLDAVRPVPEVHLVEVHLEDAVLGVAALQLERQDRFLHLALEALVRREEQHLGQLLGDGAAALDAPSAPVVLHEGARDADRDRCPSGSRTGGPRWR